VKDGLTSWKTMMIWRDIILMSWKQLLTLWILKGDYDELWAVKLVSERKAMLDVGKYKTNPTRRAVFDKTFVKSFLVIYRESKEQKDGFIITAFFTTKIQKLLTRRIIWQQPQQ
jgi:hypothetical protein